MRRMFILLVIVTVCAPVSAQVWTRQDSAQTEALHSVTFLDSSRGWAVGHNGTIRKTANGGVTWIGYITGTENDEFAVSFADSNYGWTVSAAGVVRKTTNGGATWTPQNTGTSEWLRDIVFLDTSRGWTVGQGGTILRTVNGGTTWTPQSSGTWRNINSVAFTDLQHGWAVGSGMIFKTTNGGTAWTSLSNINWLALYGVTFVDTLHGWAVGDGGQILHTVNGGASWTQQTSGTTLELHSVDFVDVNYGWVVGASGRILCTTNGGATWANQTSGTSQNLEDIVFPNINHGWAVGQSGTILHYHGSQPEVHPPAAFHLSLPADNSVINALPLNFSWLRSSDPDGNVPCYDAWLDTMVNLQSAWMVSDSVADSTITVADLPDDHIYFWTVRATDNNTAGTWAIDTFSFVLSFRADPPQPFELVLPADSFIVNEFPLSLIWQSSSDPDLGSSIRYDVLLDTLEDFSTAWQLADSIADSVYIITNSLPENHRYFWQVRATDDNTGGTWSGNTLCFIVNSLSSQEHYSPEVAPQELLLHPNYPNPFNASTTLAFSLSRSAEVAVNIYNVLGEAVYHADLARQSAGEHRYLLNADNLPSGIYWVSVSAEDISQMRKIVLIK